MYKLTEVYKIIAKGSGVRETRKRPVLVNPALIAFVKDHGEFRRVCFSGNTAQDDYIDVEESTEHIGAWVK